MCTYMYSFCPVQYLITEHVISMAPAYKTGIIKHKGSVNLTKYGGRYLKFSSHQKSFNSFACLCQFKIQVNS